MLVGKQELGRNVLGEYVDEAQLTDCPSFKPVFFLLQLGDDMFHAHEQLGTVVSPGSNGKQHITR